MSRSGSSKMAPEKYLLLAALVVIVSCWSVNGDAVTDVHLSEYIHGEYATNIKDQCIRICRYYVNPYGCIVYCTLSFAYFRFFCAWLRPPPPESCAVLEQAFNKAAAVRCNRQDIIWDCVVQFYENNGQSCTHDFSLCLADPPDSLLQNAVKTNINTASTSSGCDAKVNNNTPSATVMIMDDYGNTDVLEGAYTGITYVYGSVLNIVNIGFKNFMSDYDQGYLSPSPYFTPSRYRYCRPRSPWFRHSWWLRWRKKYFETDDHSRGRDSIGGAGSRVTDDNQLNP